MAKLRLWEGDVYQHRFSGTRWRVDSWVSTVFYRCTYLAGPEKESIGQQYSVSWISKVTDGEWGLVEESFEGYVRGVREGYADNNNAAIQR
jgi:hypothetical protein